MTLPIDGSVGSRLVLRSRSATALVAFRSSSVAPPVDNLRSFSPALTTTESLPDGGESDANPPESLRDDPRTWPGDFAPVGDIGGDDGRARGPPETSISMASADIGEPGETRPSRTALSWPAKLALLGAVSEGRFGPGEASAEGWTLRICCSSQRRFFFFQSRISRRCDGDTVKLSVLSVVKARNGAVGVGSAAQPRRRTSAESRTEHRRRGVSQRCAGRATRSRRPRRSPWTRARRAARNRWPVAGSAAGQHGPRRGGGRQRAPAGA